MSSTTRSERRREEIEEARRLADSNLLFWLFGCILLFFFIVVIFSDPRHSHNHHHRSRDDDDDNDNSWGYSTNDDDDDDDNHNKHKNAPLFHLSRLSHDDVLKTDYTGSHPKTVGCETDAHGAELMAAAKANLKNGWPEGVTPPSATLQFNESLGLIEFSVDAPYFSQDATYFISFEPFEFNSEQWKNRTDLLHVPGVCQSSQPFSALSLSDKIVHFNEMWAHAPNAFFDAKSIPADVTTRGAYSTNNQWKLSASTCARVQYKWLANAKMLQECKSSAEAQPLVSFGANSNIATVSGTLWLNLLWPDALGVGFMRWPFSFAFYVDTFESKVSIVDIPGGVHNHKPDVDSFDASLNADAVKQKIEEMQKIAARKIKTDAKDDVTALDMQLGALKWRTFSVLVDSWFTAEQDAEVFGADQTLDTPMHKKRALRLKICTTTTADAAALLEHSRTPVSDPKLVNDNETLKKHIVNEALKMTPVYDVIAIAPSLANINEDDSLYGYFSVAEADFIKNEKERHPNCEMHGTEIECHRNWTLVLNAKAPELYQSSFEVRMCDSALQKEDCSIMEPRHRVRFDIAITDPSIDVEDVNEMQIELSSHLNSASTRRLNEQAAQVNGGERVCMQSFAVGPPQLMQSIDLRTISAWICVPNDRNSNERPAEPKKEKMETKAAQSYLTSRARAGTGCEKYAHYIKIYGNDSSSTLASRYNVTLHEPGAYGSWSSVLCFNASSIFVDKGGSKVHRITQFYQTEVVAVPTEKRRHNKLLFNTALHRTFSSFASLSQSGTDAVEHRAHSVSQQLSSNFKTLTSSELGKMLQKLDDEDKIVRFQTTSFDVIPTTQRERRVHNANEHDSLWVLFIASLLGGIMVCVLAWFCIVKRRERWFWDVPVPTTTQQDDNSSQNLIISDNEDEASF